MVKLNKNYYRNYPVNPEDEEEYCPGVSSYDLTGLVPSEPQSEDELDAYEDIYPYMPDEG